MRYGSSFGTINFHTFLNELRRSSAVKNTQRVRWTTVSGLSVGVDTCNVVVRSHQFTLVVGNHLVFGSQLA